MKRLQNIQEHTIQLLLAVGARFRVHLEITFLSAFLDVSPAQSGFAFSPFREADSTSLPFLRKSIQKKMRFRSTSVLRGAKPRGSQNCVVALPYTSMKRQNSAAGLDGSKNKKS